MIVRMAVATCSLFDLFFGNDGGLPVGRTARLLGAGRRPVRSGIARGERHVHRFVYLLVLRLLIHSSHSNTLILRPTTVGAAAKFHEKGSGHAERACTSKNSALRD